jgi:predicted amidohydrolase
MRISVVQAKPVPGDFAANIERHQELIDLAASQGAELAVFPELSLTGYEPSLVRELATTPDNPRLNVFQTMADAHEMIVGVGVPIDSGAGILISMVLFSPGKARTTYSKHYIHADEEPFFVRGPRTSGILRDSESIALAICFELSIPEHAEAAAQKGAKLYLASVAKTVDQIAKANERLAEIAKQHDMTVMMANCVGPLDGEVGGGKSAVWNREGVAINRLGGSEEGILTYDTSTREVVKCAV